MLLTLLLAASLAAAPHHPQPLPQAAAAPPQETKADTGHRAAALPPPVVTKHSLTLNGRQLPYTATTGALPILSDKGEPEADIFFVAYRADGAAAGTRPLLFIFNGGPGAASVWLHLGAIGPRRVRMLPDGAMPPPPFRLEDNPYTWLDQADLVFVDPVGTGFSRATTPELTKKFSSVGGDIDVLSRFIRLFLTRYERWDAPLFLVGESYGTFRVAGLADQLAEHGVALNGIVMISAVMRMQNLSFDPGNDLPYALALPAYTATAWYHHRLAPPLQADLDQTLAAVEKWAQTDYLVALAKGDRLTSAERQAAVTTLADFTGLDRQEIERRNLRLDNRTFARLLLKDQGETVGIMDSRFMAPDMDPAAPYVFDPTVATIRPPFTATFNQYVRQELGYQSDLEYFALGGGIGHWDWESPNRYAETGDNLRDALAKNPYLRLFVASGCFDLATPYPAVAYTLAHLNLTPALRRNINVHRYRGGHMMYLDETLLGKLRQDVGGFMERAVSGRQAAVSP